MLAPPRVSPYRDFVVGDVAVGLLDRDRAAFLERWPDVFRVSKASVELQPSLADEAARSAALHRVCVALSAAGVLSPWRGERYAVGEHFGAPPLLHLERAAARYFGVWTHAAHVNGVLRRGDEVCIWFARRSFDKAIDPGLLDNLVGGGISEGYSVPQTVVKESWEEAGIEAPLARQALPTGTLCLVREQPQGLQREHVFSHDLWLPEDFAPRNQDGEAVEHRLLDVHDAAACIAGEDVTADASLVVLGFLLRIGAIAAEDPSCEVLQYFCRPPSANSTTTAPR